MASSEGHPSPQVILGNNRCEQPRLEFTLCIFITGIVFNAMFQGPSFYGIMTILHHLSR